MADHTPPTKQAIEDRQGQLGQGGDTRRGAIDNSRRGRNPDDRSTVPNAATTNHDHPTAPGVRSAAPGSGLGSGAGTAVGTAPPVPDTDGTPAAQQGLINGGINRVEDQSYTGNPRLNPPSDDAGPGPSADTPELQDPNYTAATERARR